jgi:nitronate monooxygenase
VVSATGDDTIRSDVVDIVKGYDIWPRRYNLRTLRSVVTDRWDGRAAELRTVADGEAARYAEAAARGDTAYVGATVGEAIGLIQDIAPAGAILKRMVAEAEGILRGTASSAR